MDTSTGGFVFLGVIRKCLYSTTDSGLVFAMTSAPAPTFVVARARELVDIQDVAGVSSPSDDVQSVLLARDTYLRDANGGQWSDAPAEPEETVDIESIVAGAESRLRDDDDVPVLPVALKPAAAAEFFVTGGLPDLQTISEDFMASFRYASAVVYWKVPDAFIARQSAAWVRDFTDVIMAYADILADVRYVARELIGLSATTQVAILGAREAMLVFLQLQPGERLSQAGRDIITDAAATLRVFIGFIRILKKEFDEGPERLREEFDVLEIGRASCRERV